MRMLLPLLIALQALLMSDNSTPASDAPPPSTPAAGVATAPGTNIDHVSIESANNNAAGTKNTTYSAELYDMVKSDADKYKEAYERERAKNMKYEQAERDELAKWVPEIKDGVDGLLKDAQEKQDATAVKDFEMVKESMSNVPMMADVESTRPLLRMAYAFSAKDKRRRSSDSENENDKEALRLAHEEVDKWKKESEDNGKKHKEAVELCQERGQQLQAMQRQLAEAGLLKQKFDFSLPSNREAPNNAPIPSVDPLAAFVDEIRASGTGSRVMHGSSSNHPLLGAAQSSSSAMSSSMSKY